MIDMIGGVGKLFPGTQTEATTMPGAVVSPGAATGHSFTDVLASLSTDVVDNLRTAETQSLKSVRGEADTREVVDALMTAEQSLQTAIAIRDKIVSAYLEITKMQI